MGAPSLRGGGPPYALGLPASVSLAQCRLRRGVGRPRASARLAVLPGAGQKA